MKYVFLVLSLTSFSARTFTSCSDGWLAYEGSCYLFGHDEVHFTEAEKLLANSMQPEDTARMRKLIWVHAGRKRSMMVFSWRGSYFCVQADHYWWLGLTDEVTEGRWQWFDTDEVATFTDWYPGQPNVAGEDCAIFYDNYGYQWGDILCNRASIAICEVRIFVLAEGQGPIRLPEDN